MRSERQKTQGQCPEEKQNKGYLRRVTGNPPLRDKRGRVGHCQELVRYDETDHRDSLQRVISPQTPLPLLSKMSLDLESQP